MAQSPDILVIGFSNGALILYDTLKNEVCYKTMALYKNKKAKIDVLRMSTFQVKSNAIKGESSVATGLMQSFHVNTAMMGSNTNTRSLQRRLQN